MSVHYVMIKSEKLFPFAPVKIKDQKAQVWCKPKLEEVVWDDVIF